MAVLVNRFSASASEIVAASLQEHQRAIIVGERTWGKGSVQNIIELENGRSALKLTTAGYHRPNGQNIHRFEGAGDDDVWGVRPSDGYGITLTPDETRQLLEYQRAQDIVADLTDSETDPAPGNGFVDRQLQRAVEYLGVLPRIRLDLIHQAPRIRRHLAWFEEPSPVADFLGKRMRSGADRRRLERRVGLDDRFRHAFDDCLPIG